jgi:hypothetical protein
MPDTNYLLTGFSSTSGKRVDVAVRLSDNGDGTFSLSTTGDVSKAAASTDTATPAANTAATLTYAAAGAGVSHVLSGVYISYSAAPTAGVLTILDGATTVFALDITAAGPLALTFARPIKGTANASMTVNLTAAGAAVVGRVNARHWTEQ